VNVFESGNTACLGRSIETGQHNCQCLGELCDGCDDDGVGGVGLLVTATSLDGVPVNGTFVRFAQRHEHHDSKQPLLVVFSEHGTAVTTALQTAANQTGASFVVMTTGERSISVDYVNTSKVTSR